jgi:hypothetical protein
MAWKPKTIAGKILKGVAIAGAGVGAIAAIAATGGAAAPAVAVAGKGLVGKLVGMTAKAVVQSGKGISAVAKGAANLVSGITADQRAMVKEQKAETKTGLQVLKTVKKLMNAGATAKEAAAKVGIPLEELGGSLGIPTENEAARVEAAQPEAQLKTEGCAGVFILLVTAGSLLTYFIGSLIF